MRESETILKLENAGISIKRKEVLCDLDIEIKAGDFIGIYGLNGSGKSLLSEIIGGGVRVDCGMRICAEGFNAAVVSSAEQKRMLEEDRYNDDSEFMEGKTDPGRSVIDILKLSADKNLSVSEIRHFVELFGIKHILKRGIKFLSTGEFRKMMIVRAVLSRPDIIVLDDPFTGLDIASRKMLEELIPEIKNRTKALLLISGRLDDLGDSDRLFFLNEKSISEHDDAEAIKKALAELMKPLTGDAEPVIETEVTDGPAEPAGAAELIRMSGAGMSYYEQRILSDINWTVSSGEHWQIIGANGAGKSSLLSLINGDSPKAYGQEIYLFGRRRGTGETVWEIKQNIGYVSGSLQQQHRISQNVLSIVVSGFFDSIGLYDKPNPVQVETAKRWCTEFGIESMLEKSFDSLSEGMKRAVLIIRAIVKRPRVLILDEPCQGLDDHNSEFVLAVARRVIARDHSTLLYVSHDPFYRMEEITNIMELVPHHEGGYTGVFRTAAQEQ